MDGVIIILAILFIHWIADFLLQTDWMATNKSKNNTALTAHVAAYCIPWAIAAVSFAFAYGNMAMLAFIPITFVCHWITDYFTSRLNTRLWNEKKVHWFFVSIGFDQFLHYAQLIITYQFLNSL